MRRLSLPPLVSRLVESPPRALWPSVLAGLLGVGAVARVWVALTDDGVYWPDEVYQSLEPAHRLAFGYGLVAWEFVVGARSMVLPGLLAGLLKVAAAVGLGEPRQYVTLVRLLFALASAATGLAAYRLARTNGAEAPAATLGAGAFALMGLAVYFAPRAMSEVACALPATLGLALGLEQAAARWKVLLGAALLGFAVLLRVHCALFCMGWLAVLLARRRWSDATAGAGVLALFALLWGVVDRLAWGGWFHSALLYLRFNLVEGHAADWGVFPPSYYTRHLLLSTGALWVTVGLLALAAVRRAPGLVAVSGLFFVAHLAQPHKELRFVVPFLPLACALAAVGAQELWAWRKAAGALALAALLIASVVSLARVRTLTFRQLGRDEEQVSAWDHGGPESRLLLAAHARADLCGLALLSDDRGNTGGYFYLHRDVPYYQRPPPPPEQGRYNYVIALAGQQPGEVVASDSGRELVRLAAQCTPDPGFVPALDDRARELAAQPGSFLTPN